MNIFEVVMGSNHFLIHPQTVGKKEGAPMIWEFVSSVFYGQEQLQRYSQISDPMSPDNER